MHSVVSDVHFPDLGREMRGRRPSLIAVHNAPTGLGLLNMKFAYWLAHCKTFDCHAYHIAKFIGEHDQRRKYFLPSGIPETFDFECASCHTKYTYTHADLQIVLLPFAPPPGVPEWW